MVGSSHGRRLLRKRDANAWIVDGANLTFQGTVIPWLQIAVVAGGLGLCFPGAAGRLVLHPGLVFLICFVGVDYLYYWNHRALHLERLWEVHLVHHTAEQMDLFTTSRNTLWSSLLILYVWVNGTMLYLLDDPAPCLAAMTLTFSLDLWRHSPAHPPKWLGKLLGGILVLPRDHAWHHSRDVYDVNFGANLNLWDRLHGTWHPSEEAPKDLGVLTNLNLMSKLFWPFTKKTNSAP